MTTTARSQYQDYMESVYGEPMDLPPDQILEVELAWYSGFLACMDRVAKTEKHPRHAPSLKTVFKEVYEWHRSKIKELI